MISMSLFQSFLDMSPKTLAAHAESLVEGLSPNSTGKLKMKFEVGSRRNIYIFIHGISIIPMWCRCVANGLRDLRSQS